MRRFGYRLALLFLLVFVAGCAWPVDRCRTTYDEKAMGRLATFTRVAMDIVWSDYLDSPLPSTLTEPQIVETIRRLNTDFEELRLLDRYEMVMVGDGQQLAAVVRDPENDRTLIQDLRCTKKVDAAVWRECSFGREFTLEWEACGQ